MSLPAWCRYYWAPLLGARRAAAGGTILYAFNLPEYGEFIINSYLRVETNGSICTRESIFHPEECHLTKFLPLGVGAGRIAIGPRACALRLRRCRRSRAAINSGRQSRLPVKIQGVRRKMRSLFLTGGACSAVAVVVGFAPSAQRAAIGDRRTSLSMSSQPAAQSSINRRDAMAHTLRGTAFAVASSSALISPSPALADIEGVVTIPQSTKPPTSTASEDGVRVFKTNSGLQYIELREGSGESPKYGNFVTIAYRAYVKLPDTSEKKFDLDEFDSDKAYLIKHGNGRTIPGLDEGLHTMKVGGKRRIIIPPKLGYVTNGLGPLPVGPYGRFKLYRLLEKMVEYRGGNVVVDVEMKSIMEDEADQGYYEDDSLSPEDFNTLRQNLQTSQQGAMGG